MGFSDQQWQQAPDGLKPVQWPELRARLCAAEDLRRLFADEKVERNRQGAASFHRPAARLLASCQDGEGGLNQISSANGKPPGEIASPIAGAASADANPLESRFFE